MPKVEDILCLIESLPEKEYEQLRQWFSERDQEKWDVQIEIDSKLGKLDFLITEAGDEKATGGLEKLSSHFWACFKSLPAPVQEVSKRNFELLTANPLHPSLHFKKLSQFWSVRVGISHRALAVEDGGNFIWVWIGTHNEYEQMITGMG